MSVQEKSIRIIIIVNLIFILTIVTWLFIIFQLINWDFSATINFYKDSWEFIKNFLFILSGVIFLYMAIKLLLKYHKFRKIPALLLANFNLVFGAGYLIEAWGNIVIYQSILNDMMQFLTYIAFSWAMAILFLFLQEIFANSFIERKNLRTQIPVFLFMGISVALVITSNIAGLSGVYTTLGITIIGILTILLNLWQIIAAFKLSNKAKDGTARNGLRMIGISGMLIFALLVFLLLKSIDLGIEFDFDFLIPPTAISFTIFVYLGYIYPSKARK